MKHNPNSGIKTKADRWVEKVLAEQPNPTFYSIMRLVTEKLNPNKKPAWRLPPEYKTALQRVHIL